MSASDLIRLMFPEARHLSDLAAEMQKMHDIYPPNSWKSRLAAIASEHGLDFGILDQFSPVEVA